MSDKHLVDLLASVRIEVNSPDAIDRVTGEGGDEWRSKFYDLRTYDDVLEHWAFNAIANGARRVNDLEGWADLSPDAVTMDVVHLEWMGAIDE